MNNPPAINSEWVNNKKKTLYRVWKTAETIGCGAYVVYQNVDQKTTSRNVYHVKHTETEGLVGLLYQSVEPDEYFVLTGVWRISWLDRPPNLEPIAWARPLEIWHEKFTAVDHDC